MKTTQLLRKLISEALYKSAFDELYKTYVETKELDFETLKALILMDPFTRFRGDVEEIKKMKPKEFEEAIKVGKYSKWIVKTYAKELPTLAKEKLDDRASEKDIQDETKELRRQFLEDSDAVKTLLDKYDKFKSVIKDLENRNINNIKSLEQLASIPVLASSEGDVVELQYYRGKQKAKAKDTTKKGGDVQAKFVYPGSTILRVGKNYTLIKIENPGVLQGRAASYFGGYHSLDRGETNWCTSPENSQRCQTYLQDGPLYIFMANDDKGKVGELTGLPQERYQWHFPGTGSAQFKDRANRDMNPVEFLRGPASDFYDIFKTEFAKGLTHSDSKKLVIDTFSRGTMGTYVALYGLDDLFESLPADLEDITISQSGNQPIMIRIPDSITRFQNLSSLILDNSISEVNPAICELKNLTVLGLEDNKSLTSIPDCLWSMKMLIIINVRGSNVKIDKSRLVSPWQELEPEIFFKPEGLN